MTAKSIRQTRDQAVRRQPRRLGRDQDADAREPVAAPIAAILRLQQIHGNLAVQRMMRDGRAAPYGGTATIQRDDDESFLPEATVGDWNILPPKPATSTDDRYDTPQNQDRAERRDEDARSNDPNLYDWWTPQQPGDAGPLLPTNESSPVENELPPPEPEQPGDYPSPLPSEEERYA